MPKLLPLHTILLDILSPTSAKHMGVTTLSLSPNSSTRRTKQSCTLKMILALFLGTMKKKGLLELHDINQSSFILLS
jgi:hypothetical protein